MSPARAALQADAQTLTPLAQHTPAKEFLRAAQALPPQVPRVVYTDRKRRTSITPAKWEALPADQQGAYTRETHDETFYYATFYGSPLAYVRALDIAGQFGLATLDGARILDIGYGAIGAPRLIGAAGGEVSAVDVDSLLPALYRERDDYGVFKGMEGRTGTLALYDGVYAGDASMTKAIGGHFDMIVSKNTLKRGFMKPLAGHKPYVEFGVNDADFLATVHRALAPGGLFLIYNIMGAFSPEKPSTDGHTPFDRDALVKAGFSVLAFDARDDAQVRAMGAALAWDKDMGDLTKSLFAVYTVARKAP
jgi:SAM-dependent methyltransferase